MKGLQCAGLPRELVEILVNLQLVGVSASATTTVTNPFDFSAAATSASADAIAKEIANGGY